MKLIALALSLAFFTFAGAEIQNVTLRWIPGGCTTGCNQMLGQRFQMIPGVASINVNPPAGQMDVRWKPNFPLNFQPINAAFSSVGPSIEEMRVKVRGTLQSNGKQFFLISIGDNTMFQLLGFPQAQPNQYIPLSYNPINYPLSPSMIQQFNQAAAQNQITIIDGPILAPERSPPWMLIVQNVQFVQAPQVVQPLQTPLIRPQVSPYQSGPMR